MFEKLNDSLGGNNEDSANQPEIQIVKAISGGLNMSIQDANLDNTWTQVRHEVKPQDIAEDFEKPNSLTKIYNSKSKSQSHISESKTWKYSQNESFRTKTRWVSIKDAARRLKVCDKTIRRWCEAGRLPAIPQKYGSRTTYLVLADFLEAINEESEMQQTHLNKTNCNDRNTSINELNVLRRHAEYVSGWESAMRHRLIPGKKRYCYSARTIEDYKSYVIPFLDRLQELSLATLKQELERIPEAQVPTKEKAYKALICFGKYLIAEGQLEEAFLASAALIRPSNVGYNVKRLKVSGSSVGKAYKIGARNRMEKVIICLLAKSGLRADEAACLKWCDIDFDTCELIVRRGKGGKSRTIGMTKQLANILRKHKALSAPATNDYVCLNTQGQPFTSKCLSKTISRIGERAGVKLTAHSLRRFFVISNVKRGVPLSILQHACGHTHIRITENYCLLDETDVVKTMRALD